MFNSLKKMVLIAVVFSMSCSVLWAGSSFINAKDEKLEQVITQYFYSGIIHKIYSNSSDKKQLLDAVNRAGAALKEYASILATLSPNDPRQKNLEVARMLQQHLTKIKATVLQDGYASAIEKIEDLYSYITLLLNSVEIEMVVNVKKFSTKFIVLHSGNSIGKRAINGIVGQVFHGNNEFNVPMPERFSDFLKENSNEMTLTIDLAIDNKKLVELERLPDVYGYPKKAVSVVVSVRLFHIVTNEVNVMAPEIIQIKKINYR